MINYKFRAECDLDVMKFALKFNQNGKGLIKDMQIVRQKIYDTIPIPDVEVTFQSSVPIDHIKQVMAMVEDGHVMYQTLKPEAEYTGKREENIINVK